MTSKEKLEHIREAIEASTFASQNSKVVLLADILNKHVLKLCELEIAYLSQVELEK